MDVDGARNCLHVQDLLAKREKLAVRVRALLEREKRLRRVRENAEQSQRLLANVTPESKSCATRSLRECDCANLW
ncbi:hypothetical protein MRX96_041152 [Rhipicephalus microplus]